MKFLQCNGSLRMACKSPLSVEKYLAHLPDDMGFSACLKSGSGCKLKLQRPMEKQLLIRQITRDINGISFLVPPSTPQSYFGLLERNLQQDANYSQEFLGPSMLWNMIRTEMHSLNDNSLFDVKEDLIIHISKITSRFISFVCVGFKGALGLPGNYSSVGLSKRCIYNNTNIFESEVVYFSPTHKALMLKCLGDTRLGVLVAKTPNFVSPHHDMLNLISEDLKLWVANSQARQTLLILLRRLIGSKYLSHKSFTAACSASPYIIKKGKILGPSPEDLRLSCCSSPSDLNLLRPKLGRHRLANLENSLHIAERRHDYCVQIKMSVIGNLWHALSRPDGFFYRGDRFDQFNDTLSASEFDVPVNINHFGIDLQKTYFWRDSVVNINSFSKKWGPSPDMVRLLRQETFEFSKNMINMCKYPSGLICQSASLNELCLLLSRDGHPYGRILMEAYQLNIIFHHHFDDCMGLNFYIVKILLVQGCKEPLIVLLPRNSKPSLRQHYLKSETVLIPPQLKEITSVVWKMGPALNMSERLSSSATESWKEYCKRIIQKHLYIHDRYTSNDTDERIFSFLLFIDQLMELLDTKSDSSNQEGILRLSSFKGISGSHIMVQPEVVTASKDILAVQDVLPVRPPQKKSLFLSGIHEIPINFFFPAGQESSFLCQ